MNAGLFILGVALLVLGLFMYGYTEAGDEGLYFGPPDGSPNRPYAPFGVVILIAGLLFMIISAVTPEVSRKTVSSTEVIERPKRKTVVHEERI